MKSREVFYIALINLLFCVIQSAVCQTETVKKVVLDAGHGGKDPGCLGSMSFEKDVALEITLLVKNFIEQYIPDVEIILTRNKDVFVPLHQRAAIANESGADLFISIHCNANPSKAKTGTETYVMGLNAQETNRVVVRENSSMLSEKNYLLYYEGFDPSSPLSYILIANYQHNFQGKSLNFAHKVERHFQEGFALLSRGVKQDIFWVLAKTAMPSALIETGFLTNTQDERYLNSQQGKLSIAASIYRAFRDYKNEIEGKYKLFNQN